LAPITDLKKVRYEDLRSALLANYLERGNRSLETRADGEETIGELKALDSFSQRENPSPNHDERCPRVCSETTSPRHEQRHN
jgi:hypothetical protein